MRSGDRCGCRKFQNTNPERGRKQTTCKKVVDKWQLFQNTNPERGRKLGGLTSLQGLIFIISEHEPRKGTETLEVLHFLQYGSNFRTRTPKGDGNGCRLFVLGGVCSHFRTRTPKGDGNVAKIAAFQYLSQSISEHEPRKGTETPPPMSLRRCRRGFQNTNPERGRKRSLVGRARKSASSPFQNTNPERGRKPCSGRRFATRKTLFQNTNPERGRKPVSRISGRK